LEFLKNVLLSKNRPQFYFTLAIFVFLNKIGPNETNLELKFEKDGLVVHFQLLPIGFKKILNYMSCGSPQSKPLSSCILKKTRKKLLLLFLVNVHFYRFSINENF